MRTNLVRAFKQSHLLTNRYWHCCLNSNLILIVVIKIHYKHEQQLTSNRCHKYIHQCGNKTLMPPPPPLSVPRKRTVHRSAFNLDSAQHQHLICGTGRGYWDQGPAHWRVELTGWSFGNRGWSFECGEEGLIVEQQWLDGRALTRGHSYTAMEGGSVEKRLDSAALARGRSYYWRIEECSYS